MHTITNSQARTASSIRALGSLISVTILAAALSGCADRKKMWSESEIRAIAEDHSDAAVQRSYSTINHNAEAGSLLVDRVEELEETVSRQQQQIERLQRNQNEIVNWTYDLHAD
ncbi:MAG: hypothetical protein HKO13_04370 [Sphingomonas sp.]|nr:hypothetical protein [Sphingomonas sp.]